MYTSPTEARSDFFLAAAVFAFGPIALVLLVDVLGLNGLPGVREVSPIVITFAVTALVPLLLLRYRREPLAAIGFTGSAGAALTGALLALPVVLATVLVNLIVTGSALLGLPVLNLSSFGAWLLLTRRLVFWLGMSFLLLYATAKARDAFRPFTMSLREAAQQVGLILAGVAFGSTLLLLVGGAHPLLFFTPLGVAGMVGIAFTWTTGRTTTDRWTVWAPVLLAAVGLLAITVQADQFLAGLRSAALIAAFGLFVVLVLETRRPAETVIGAALALSLLTNLGGLF